MSGGDVIGGFQGCTYASEICRFGSATSKFGLWARSGQPVLFPGARGFLLENLLEKVGLGLDGLGLAGLPFFLFCDGLREVYGAIRIIGKHSTALGMFHTA
jgi:hypothetical protein